MVDLISAENSSSKIELNRPRIAAIDIGTNSVHMVVVEIKPELPAFTIIDREKATVRLGDRDLSSGNLTPEAINRALAALKRCQEVAKGLQVTEIIAVATSATRESPNGRDFIHQIKQDLGLEVNLISGQEEARRIYLGVLSGIEFNQEPHIIIDIGGGSTELVLADSKEARVLTSTKVGAVRLTAEFVHSDPISNTDFTYLQAFICGQLERSIEEIKGAIQRGERLKLVGTSGTIETLCLLIAAEKNGQSPLRTHGFQINLNELQGLINKLRKLSLQERSQLPGMNDRRAEIIIAGALILQEAMLMLGLTNITFCERALREGVIVDWMLTHNYIDDRLQFQSSVKERSTLKIADKYGIKIPANQQVAKLALSLFDQTKGILHHWSDNARELLWSAAILHNCGYYISHAAHHKHSYYLIRYGELLGYTETEIDLIANIARYHRKSPPKKKHENFQPLSKPYRLLVSQLSALLRLAVALDRRQLGVIKEIQFSYDSQNKIGRLNLFPTNDQDECTLEIWSFNYEKSVAEIEFNISLIAQKTV
jgi:exopolyphosphatase/guanosine-5'-triphosphate,3'-diphosphate pyrophosphatase